MLGVAVANLTGVDPLGFFAGLLLAIAAIGGGLFLGVLASAKRHVSFYRDERRGEKVLEVLQDKKFQFLLATFTIRDGTGKTLALLRKNYLYDFFRKQWECRDPQGQMLCMAKEDSVILSLMRRFLGPMLGLLRANFVFTTPDGQQVIGEFNRKFTLLDRYVLDLSADPQRTLDRRLALAIGVMLDTAEKR